MYIHNRDTLVHVAEIKAGKTFIMSVFLISSYGVPLAQRVPYLALHSFLYGPDDAVNYDYIVTNRNNSSLIVSRCIPNGTHDVRC